MGIRARILFFQVVVGAIVIAMAAIAYVDIRSTAYYLGRVQAARGELDAMTRLAVHANRYSEQIAELLLIGEPERPDFESARNQVSDVLAELHRLTTHEIAFVQDAEEREEERQELDSLDRMQALFQEIDRAVERLLLLEQDGRHDQAVALFRSEIENRLDAELEQLIAKAIAGEQKEVAKADARAKSLWQWLTGATLTALAVLLAATILAGVRFARSLRDPIQELTEGARAIGGGDLDHRIAYSGPDELGLLSEKFNDMAEQLKRERGLLLEAQTSLERQVGERTVALAEANRQLTELDRQRVRFLADVSHELRTPLTVLRGEAEVALRDASHAEQVYREALKTVVGQAAEMGSLIDDLLFLARSDADEIRFEMRPVQVSAIASQVIEEASALARRKQIEISSHLDGAELMIRADPRRLKQVMLIILDNAIKYSQAETNIDVSVFAGKGDGVTIRIRDRGAGMMPDELPHVFERFYRGGRAREESPSGSGLGLPIARWIVEKHGGAIRVSSLPGEGTEVDIMLPGLGSGRASDPEKRSPA